VVLPACYPHYGRECKMGITREEGPEAWLAPWSTNLASAEALSSNPNTTFSQIPFTFPHKICFYILQSFLVPLYIY
jgi:hypothetical protein